MDLAELSLILDRRLDRELKPGRARHSRAVAALAAELCARHGLDPEAGRAAGLGHDLCKELPLPLQVELAAAYANFSGRAFVAEGRVGAAAVHGPAAAALLRRDYGLEDRELLDAVALHTLGAREMGDLARILYAADKLEPGRSHVDPAFREACLALGPEELFARVFRDCLDWHRSEGLEIAEESLALYDSIALREIEA